MICFVNTAPWVGSAVKSEFVFFSSFSPKILHQPCAVSYIYTQHLKVLIFLTMLLRSNRCFNLATGYKTTESARNPSQLGHTSRYEFHIETTFWYEGLSQSRTREVLLMQPDFIYSCKDSLLSLEKWAFFVVTVKKCVNEITSFYISYGRQLHGSSTKIFVYFLFHHAAA